MQFLDTASQLHIFTVKQCAKFPKRYTYYVSQQLAHESTQILVNAKIGNDLYPTNTKEVQDRRSYLFAAYGHADAMISLIGDAKEMFPISGRTLTEWMEMIRLEMRLLRGVMKADRAKYRRIFGDALDYPIPDEDQDSK